MSRKLNISQTPKVSKCICKASVRQESGYLGFSSGTLAFPCSLQTSSMCKRNISVTIVLKGWGVSSQICIYHDICFIPCLGHRCWLHLILAWKGGQPAISDASSITQGVPLAGEQQDPLWPYDPRVSVTVCWMDGIRVLGPQAGNFFVSTPAQ